MSSGEPLPNLSQTSKSRNAFALILSKLGRRDYTEKELRTALSLKEFGEDAITAALARAKGEGLVNDVRLASALARSAARSGKRGPLRLIAALRQKGIAPETAQAAAREAFTSSDEAEDSLNRFATRLLERTRGETLKEKRIKVVRSLLGRGFQLSEAKRALRIAETALMTENGAHDADADE